MLDAVIEPAALSAANEAAVAAPVRVSDAALMPELIATLDATMLEALIVLDTTMEVAAIELATFILDAETLDALTTEVAVILPTTSSACEGTALPMAICPAALMLRPGAEGVVLVMLYRQLTSYAVSARL